MDSEHSAGQQPASIGAAASLWLAPNTGTGTTDTELWQLRNCDHAAPQRDSACGSCILLCNTSHASAVISSACIPPHITPQHLTLGSVLAGSTLASYLIVLAGSTRSRQHPQRAHSLPPLHMHPQDMSWHALRSLQRCVEHHYSAADHSLP
eukprot:jgi/Ulvmu1/8572/UM045_0014.1